MTCQFKCHEINTMHPNNASMPPPTATLQRSDAAPAAGQFRDESCICPMLYEQSQCLGRRENAGCAELFNPACSPQRDLTRIPKLIGAIWRNLLAASAIRRASPYLSDTLRPSSCHRDSASCTISSPPTSEFGFKRECSRGVQEATAGSCESERVGARTRWRAGEAQANTLELETHYRPTGWRAS